MDFLYAYCLRAINRIWDLETRQSCKAFCRRSLRKASQSPPIAVAQISHYFLPYTEGYEVLISLPSTILEIIDRSVKFWYQRSSGIRRVLD
jgi:hypothetical protein